MSSEERHRNEEKIRARAYELYEGRGYQHGHAESDWLQAEHELREELRMESRISQLEGGDTELELPEAGSDEESEERPMEQSERGRAASSSF